MKETISKKMKEAGVLLIAAVMILSTVVVSAESDAMDKLENDGNYVNTTISQNMDSSDSLFLQLPHDPDESWTMVTSDSGAGYIVYENFWDITELIGNIYWWGLCLKYVGGWQAGNPDNLVFDIKFYADDPDDHNLPNELVATFTNIVPPVISTGQYYAGFEMYYFDGAVIEPFVDLSEGWVSINSKSSGAGKDWLMWASAKTGDGFSYQGGATPPGNAFDQAMKLTAGSYPPDPPATPNGPTDGILGVEYMFSTSTTDPEEGQVSYWWDWDDGTPGEWSVPYDSGATVYASHIWTEAGEYEIRVKARDLHGKESTWSSPPKTIHIVDTAVLEISNITGNLFRVSAVIRNIGGVDATRIDWSITFDGGFIPRGEASDSILSIPAGAEVTISSDLIFGFGKTVITATAECTEGSSDTKTRDAFVFLFFIV